MNKYSQQYNLKNRDYERLFESTDKGAKLRTRPQSAKTAGQKQNEPARRRRIHSATVRKVASYIIDTEPDQSAMQLVMYQEESNENTTIKTLKPNNLSLTVDNSNLVKSVNSPVKALSRVPTSKILSTHQLHDSCDATTKGFVL